MNKFDKTAVQSNSDFFRALGHPTRLWIVEQLSDGAEHCVCEFVNAVGDKFPTISRHLSVLKDASVVSEDKRGKQVFYRLACPCIVQMLNCLKSRQY